MSTVSCTTPNTYLLSICCSQLSGSRDGDQCVLPLSVHPEIAGRFRACTVGADSSCSDGSSNDARFGGLGTTTEGSDGTPTSLASPTSADASAEDASRSVDSTSPADPSGTIVTPSNGDPPDTTAVNPSNTGIPSKEADADHASEISGSGKLGTVSTSASTRSGPGASAASGSSSTRSRRVAVAPLLVGSLLATLGRW